MRFFSLHLRSSSLAVIAADSASMPPLLIRLQMDQGMAALATVLEITAVNKMEHYLMLVEELSAAGQSGTQPVLQQQGRPMGSDLSASAHQE